jgi:UDP-N-acetylglucosamine 4,6-dehydratase
MSSWLITGGSGFLGRALVRKLLTQGVDRICVYSRGEHAQAEARASIHDPENRIRWMIGDVRDRARLRWATKDVDVVIHAAALKRIEVGAYAPTEMIETNVRGAENIVDAAAYNGVWKVVGISSDKAWQPISPYGQSKALAESVFLAAGVERPGPMYAVVRYGNVWCSTGSVVPTWRKRIEKNQVPVPVTDPNCTRFFMRIEDAVSLITRTVKIMKGGELVVPDWLPAYRISDLAQAMGVEMEIIGLPAHEKLHEGMRDDLISSKARRMTIGELKSELRRG